MYRNSKNKSEIIIHHWQNALDEIISAEKLFSTKKDLQLDSLLNIISSAR